MKNIILNLFILLFLTCCTYEDTKDVNNIQTIDINEDLVKKEILLSKIFDSIKIMSLRYEQGQIGKIETIKKYKNKYFIHDNTVNQILIFNIEGDYLNRIYSQGPGPKEYGNINYFDIDKEKDEVVIFDIREGELSYYDFNGSFMRKVPLRIICRDFALTENGNFICYAPDEMVELNGEVYQPGIFLLSRNGKMLDYEQIGNTTFIPMLAGKGIVDFMNKDYLFTHYNNNIYEITDIDITPIILLNFKNELITDAFVNPNYKTENMDAPFLKINPYMRKDHLGFTFLQKNKIRFIDINIQDGTYEIGKALNKNEKFKYFSLNGYQVADNEFLTVLDDELLLQYEYYLEDNPNYFQEFEELREMLSKNDWNPLIISGFFK